MMHDFDKDYWESHWRDGLTSPGQAMPENPYLATELADVPVGSALDAGCGAGAEARWLAAHGWQVTAADISSTVLARAEAEADARGAAGRIDWLEVDLDTWRPARTWDLVTTHYAHPRGGQLAFYARLASWVAPGGTLLVVGHRHGEHGGHDHPEGATATVDGVRGLLSADDWRIDSDYEASRTVAARGGVVLHDVVVRAHRRS